MTMCSSMEMSAPLAEREHPSILSVTSMKHFQKFAHMEFSASLAIHPPEQPTTLEALL